MTYFDILMEFRFPLGKNWKSGDVPNVFSSYLQEVNDYDLPALTPTNPSEATENLSHLSIHGFSGCIFSGNGKVFGPSPFSNIKSCQHIIASEFYEVLFTNPKPYDLCNEFMLISFSQSRRTLGVAVRIL